MKVVNVCKQKKTIFSWDNGVTTEMDPYVGRLHLITDLPKEYGLASINLTSIRDDDTGWFECRILFRNRIPSSRNNGTWYFLTVNGKKSITHVSLSCIL